MGTIKMKLAMVKTSHQKEKCQVIVVGEKEIIKIKKVEKMKNLVQTADYVK